VRGSDQLGDGGGRCGARGLLSGSYFTVVGCHGLHVTAGLIWLAVMMAQVAIKGFLSAASIAPVGQRLGLLRSPVLTYSPGSFRSA
jgi:hypothetical protein